MIKIFKILGKYISPVQAGRSRRYAGHRPLLRFIGAALLVILLAVWLPLNYVQAEEAKTQKFDTLRVGFFHFNGYHEIDKQGKYSGYGYDLLQMLRPYLHCNYEYVGYDKGWEDMLNLLERGEIDFVSSVIKTPQRQLDFDYSELPIGYCSVLMTVKNGATRYKTKDYKRWNGIRVGMLKVSSKNDIFFRFAQSKGFSCRPSYFVTSDELESALQSGKIDAIAAGSLRKTSNEVIYEQIGLQPFYIIVKKGNHHLLDRINDALDALSLETPGYAQELRQIYYGHWHINAEQVPFPFAEQSFIRRAQQTGRQFTVLMRPGHFPLEYDNDGQPSGVFPDVVKLLAKRSGLSLKIVMPESIDEYHRQRDECSCDMLVDVPHDFQWAEKHGYVQTKPYYPVGLSILTKKRSLGEIHTVATLQDSLINCIVQSNKPKNVVVRTFPSNEASIQAVIDGKVDGAYLLNPLVENAILNDRSSSLTQEPSTRVLDFAVSIRNDSDARFISIIAKCVNSLSKRELLKIARDNNVFLNKQVYFRDFVIENPVIFSTSVFLLISLLAAVLVVVLIYHKHAVSAAALLNKHSRMWKLLLDSLPIQIFAKDIESFKFVYNNKNRAEFFGIPPERLTQMDDFDLVSKEEAEAKREADKQLVAAGTGSDIRILRVKGSDGQMHLLYSILVPFSDKDGTQLLLGCSVDQTELDKTRSEAQEHAEWFHKTLISIGDAVLTTDREGRISLINPVAEQMLGVTLEECRGLQHTDFFNLVSFDTQAPVQSPVELCLASGEVASLAEHTVLISRSGVRFHIADSAAPIRNSSGEIAGVVLVFRDITREHELRERLQASADQLRIALDQAQRASSAKGVFLSQMSHEIRTPLNAIIGYLNIAKDSDHNQDKLLECINKGLEASNILACIINDILDISSIESGKLKIAHESFNLKSLLTGIVTMFYTQAEKLGINFEIQLIDITEEWMIGDSLRVNQILINLLSNALKFTAAGGSVKLSIKQLGNVNNRVQLLIKVADTGCGMSEDYKKRLFKPFEQQDASTARKYGGTGLGLSITKNLLSLMGGIIEVESTQGQGTVFTLNIPFDRSSKSAAAVDLELSKLRALIVDNVEEECSYLRQILKKCGIKSDVVASGEEAIVQLERRLGSRHAYDLCLMDQSLPGISGIETAGRLRELCSQAECQAKQLIILVTAYNVISLTNEAQSNGVNIVLQKPLFPSTFFDFLLSTYYHVSEKKSATEASMNLAGACVLLVEDNRMNMDISTQYLERAGITITQAWNGRQALDLFLKSKPGTYLAILMDVQMPIMDGYQATAAIRSSRHPEANTIPIIAMTANAFSDDVVIALKHGMNDHISKPVVYERLYASLSKLANKKQNQAEENTTDN